MKKYVSVWALLARSSFLKIAVLLAGMAAAECGLLWAAAQTLVGEGQGEPFIYGSGPERIWKDSLAWFPFLITLGLIFAVLVWAEGRQKDSRVEYTWRRLRLTKRQQVTVKIFYNMSCFVILFAVQVSVALWFLSVYRRIAPSEMISPQIYFLTFMRSKYLHNVLPFAETGKWLRNALILSAFSITAAKGVYEEKASNKTFCISLFLVAACWFYSEMGLNVQDVFIDLVCGACVAADLIRLSGISEEHKE